MQKTVPPLFIAFFDWYGFLWPPRKISGCVIGAKETHPDILCGGHRNPYQLKNAIKSGGTVFCIYQLVDHILSKVRPATKELSAVLSTSTKY